MSYRNKASSLPFPSLILYCWTTLLSIFRFDYPHPPSFCLPFLLSPIHTPVWVFLDSALDRPEPCLQIRCRSRCARPQVVFSPWQIEVVPSINTQDECDVTTSYIRRKHVGDLWIAEAQQWGSTLKSMIYSSTNNHAAAYSCNDFLPDSHPSYSIQD